MKKHYNEVFGYYYSQLEIETLAMLAVGKKNCLEIGSYLGKSSIAIAMNAEKVLCIDTFQAAADKFDENGNLSQTGDTLPAFLTNTRGYDNVRFLKGRSEVEVPLLKESFDLIFIDGDHSYEGAKKDIPNCWALLKISGLLVLHDYWDIDDPNQPNSEFSTSGVGIAYREFFDRIDGRQTSLVWIEKKAEDR